MKSAAVAIAVVVFSVAVAHLVETGRASLADTRPVLQFSPDQELQAFSPSGATIRAANTQQELEHYAEVEKLRKIDKATGRNFPHCIYTVPSGTKCLVEAQFGTSVKVMWEDGPMIQAIGWVDARDLTGRKP